MLKIKRIFCYPVIIILAIFAITNLEAIKVYAGSTIKVAVDPGHGGYEPGAVLKGVIEKNVSLDISKKLELTLKHSSLSVILTRTTDAALYQLSKKGDTLKRRDLNARVNIINNSKAKLFTSIHVNSNMSNKKCAGTIVYYYKDSIKSKELAESIQASINKIIINNHKRPEQKPRPATFYILKRTKMPGVLIETAFVSNRGDRSLLQNEAFKNKLAKAILSGIRGSKIYKSSIPKRIVKPGTIKNTAKRTKRG